MLRLFTFVICSFILTAGYAQVKPTPLFSPQFEHISLPELFHSIESTSAFFFYYDAGQVDSVFVDINLKDKPIEAVLQTALKNSGLQFSIDRLNHVFISKRVRVITVLAPSFFGDDKIHSTAFDSTTGITAQKEPTTRMTVENKLYEIGIKTNNPKQMNAVLTGIVRNARTGEPIVNTSIYIEGSNKIVTTDQYGYYSIGVPAGKHTLNVQAFGMKDANYQLWVYSDGKLDIELKEQVRTLKEVVISTQKVANINRIQMGLERLDIQTIRQVPTVFGESDVLKVVLTLPGVKTVGEASSGFNVRGGSADQNLILLNQSTIYNPSHFFGMFSAFNPEIVKDIELYKSSVPAKYGGRLSSVLDISSREGNKKNYSGSAGIGLITSRFNLEGPIVKDKTSFIFGARTTYANWLLSLLPDIYNHSRASFQDANLGISHRVNSKNDLYLNSYFSNDKFRLANDTSYAYSNRSISLKWKHSFNNNLNGVFFTGYDKYKFSVSSEKNNLNAYRMAFDIAQASFKSDFSLFVNAAHSFDFGAGTLLYHLHPGLMEPDGPTSQIRRDEVEGEQALESGVYVTHRFTASSRFSIVSGFRYSYYNYLGPHQVFLYAANSPMSETSIIDTVSYKKGKSIKNYGNPEFRISARFALTPGFSVKASYNTMSQYIHMLSNTTAISPTDVWKLSDPNIKPQTGDQLSLGFYKNLKSNTIETSVELYYKRIKNYLDYKPGATLVLNHHIETEVIETRGKAYGIEVLVKKPGGKLNGWISYTYSRILLQANDPTLGQFVNFGQYYPANYDKPHDATMAGNFRVNHRFSISMNTTYSTGRPITLPVGRFFYAGSQRVLYSERNKYRIPDYFRADFSMNVQGNHKVKQKTHNSWTIGIYNLTGRKNAYSVYYTSENGRVNGYRLSIFGSAIPFVNFNIRF
jgi:hypothetical protein